MLFVTFQTNKSDFFGQIYILQTWPFTQIYMYTSQTGPFTQIYMYTSQTGSFTQIYTSHMRGFLPLLNGLLDAANLLKYVQHVRRYFFA
jgi:hypothetical protein